MEQAINYNCKCRSASQLNQAPSDKGMMFWFCLPNRYCIQILSYLSSDQRLRVVQIRGSPSSILTSYLESAGSFTLGVKFSLDSVLPLQRCYNIKGQSKLGMENLNWGNPFSPDDIVTPGAWHYCCDINVWRNFWKSESWLRLKLPITGIKMMHSLTGLARN